MSELTLDDARRVTAAAEGRALELGCAVTITVTDAGGHVRAQARLEGARFGTLNVSTNKAFTAAAFGAPTKILAGLTQPGQDLFGFADASTVVVRHPDGTETRHAASGGKVAPGGAPPGGPPQPRRRYRLACTNLRLCTRHDRMPHLVCPRSRHPGIPPCCRPAYMLASAK